MINQRRRLRRRAVDRFNLGDHDGMVARFMHVGYAALQNSKVMLKDCVAAAIFVPATDYAALTILLGEAVRDRVLIVRKNVDGHAS